MAGERTFLVRILGNSDSAITAFKKLGREGSDALSTVFDVAKKGALIATAAAGAIGAAAFSAVKAATEDQASQKNLADQLRRTMQATDDQIASVEQFISKQQMLVGVSDDQLRPALANLARATGDITFAQSNLGLALDISAATGQDLEAVSLALGKAFTGNIGALTKLGIPLDENVKKSKDLGGVIETLNQQFGGAASAAADTFAGRLNILKVSLGEAQEGIGYALLPIAEKLVAFIQSKVVPVIQAFADELSGGGSLRDALVAGAAQAGEFGLKVINMVEAVVNAVGQIANVFIDLAKPIILTGGVIGSLIALVRNGVDGFNSVGLATNNFVASLDNLKTNTAVTSAAFDRFRDDVLGVAAAATVTQEQLRGLDQVQRGIAAGGPVQRFIGPLLAGYGSLAPKVKTAEQLQEEFNKVLAGLQSTGGGAATTLKTVKEKLEDYNRSLEKVTSETKSFASATKGVIAAKKQLGERILDVGKRELDVTDRNIDLVKRQGDVVKANINITKRKGEVDKRNADIIKREGDLIKRNIDLSQKQLDVTKRRNELSERNIDLAKAQQNFNEAVAGFGEDSIQAKEAQLELAEAQRNVEQSGYRVETALFAITAAEEALKSVRMDSASTAQDIRKAEIELAEAKLNLAEAQADQIGLNKQQTDSQSKLNQAIFGALQGSEIYDDLLTDLKDAQDAQLSATEALTQASEDLVGAQEAVADAAQDIISAREAAADAAQDVIDAEENLADAIREVGKAQQDIVDAKQAVVDAIEAVAEAHDKIKESVEAEAEAYRQLEVAIKKAAAAAGIAGKKFVQPVLPALSTTTSPIPSRVLPLPGVPTPTGGGTGFAGQADPSVQIVVNTGIGTNGVEAGRQIVQLLQQYTAVDAFAIDRLGFAPRR